MIAYYRPEFAPSNIRTRNILVPAKTPHSSPPHANGSNSSWIHKLSWRGYHFALVAFSVYLLIVLATFDASDPTSTQVFDTYDINNAGGSFGAILADLFFWALGIIAYLIPILIIQYEVTRFIGHSRYAKHETQSSVWFKGLSFSTLIVAACVYAFIHITNTGSIYPQGSGGLLGLTLGLPLHQTFGMTGTNILVLTTMLLALSQFWQLRWGNITEALGRLSMNWLQHLRQSLFGEKSDRQKQQQYQATKASKAAQNNYYNPSTKATKRSLFMRPIVGSWSYISSLRWFQGRDKNATPDVSKPIVPQHKATLTGASKESRLNGLTEDFSVDQVAAALDSSATKSRRLKATPTPVDETIKSPQAAQKMTPPQVPMKEVKIVPLSETHQQDTGSSQAEQHDKIIKHKHLPPVSLLDSPSVSLNPAITAEELTQLSQLLESKLLDFGVIAEVVEVNPGPVITRIEIRPAPGTKVSKISNLSKDLARSMAVMSVRVVEVIAGKSVIGIEIPNQHREMVRISEVIGSKPYLSSSSPLTLTLGNDIAGKPVVVDLAKMPHLLVAGTTGSGKSVGVNAMIMSILLKSTPDQVRMLLVDPKMLELSIYDGIPHLLAPVITDMKEAAGGLRWCVAEMERRYRLMASQGVRNLAGFNTKVTSGEPVFDPIWMPDEANGENVDDRPYLEPLPYIVVVVDEFADMIMVVGKKVEELIARIAQKARAAGIHLILATQRPSVDVITGLIKANVPTRIAFQVSSKIDSRTILDQGGAESLLGHGDMLYLPPGKSTPERVHGAFVSDDEVHRVVEAWKERGAPQFIEAIVEGNYDQEVGFGLASSEGAFEEDKDRLYDEAVAFITETRRASISSVQRKFKIGYNRAARMIEAMEAAGVISPPAHNGAREVLAPPPPRD